MNRWQLLLTGIILGVLASCSGGPKVTSTQPEAPTQALPGGPTLRQIEPVVAEDRTRVMVRADYPLNYTSYAPDATTLVVELPNANGSLLPATEIPVASADLDSIRVERFEDAFGGPTTRLVLSSAPGFRHEIRTEGSELVIDVIGAQRASAAAPEGAPAAEPVPGETLAPAPGSIEEELAMEEPTYAGAPLEEQAAVLEPESPAQSGSAGAAEQAKLPAATALTRVKIQQGGAGPRITLEGDGALEYETFQLANPPRLVVDLKHVTNRTRQPRLTASGPVLSAVRIAQFKSGGEPIARVVFDLSQQTSFQVVPSGSRIDVLLGESARAAEQAPQVMAQSVLPQAEPIAAPPAEPSSVAPAAGEAAAELQPMPGSVAEPAAAPPDQAAETQAATGEEAGAAETFVDSEAEFVPFEAEPAAPAGPGPVASTQPRRGKVTDIRMAQMAFTSKTIAGGGKQYTGKRISISFRDADLKDVFRLFHEISGLNIVLDPGVSGRITIILDNVPWDQALDVILKNNGLDKVFENNLIRIATTQKLAQEASARKALLEAQELEVEAVTFTRVLSYAKAQGIVPVVKKVLSKRGDIIHDERTNSLIISDVPQKKDAVNRLIDTLDTRTPQVMIEARIIETDRDFTHDFGIVWGFTGRAEPALGTQTGLQFPHRARVDYDVSLPAAAASSTLGLSFGNVLDSFTLDVELQAFEQNGSVRVLSAPKVATQNNEKAVIEQGVQIPVVNTTATEINVEFISASLKLEVTPQITADDTIILDVKIDNSSPDFVNRVGDVPPIITERAETIILIKNGGTAVIGGIFKLNDSVSEARVPGLSKLPLLGWLFKNKSVVRDNSELLVFLTPRIL